MFMPGKCVTGKIGLQLSGFPDTFDQIVYAAFEVFTMVAMKNSASGI
jgi:hypothetical protein